MRGHTKKYQALERRHRIRFDMEATYERQAKEESKRGEIEALKAEIKLRKERRDSAETDASCTKMSACRFNIAERTPKIRRRASSVGCAATET